MAPVLIALYEIDGGMSRFTIRAFAGGLLSGLGHNPVLAIRDMTGEVRYDPEALEHSSLTLKINTAGIEVQNTDMSDKDRREMKRAMDQEVLEVARFPLITYRSKAATAGRNGTGRLLIDINGKLELHGVERPQTVATQLMITGDLLRANGEFTLRQTDYAIKLASVGGSMLKIKDELKCTFDVVARRKYEDVPG